MCHNPEGPKRARTWLFCKNTVIPNVDRKKDKFGRKEKIAQRAKFKNCMLLLLFDVCDILSLFVIDKTE